MDDDDDRGPELSPTPRTPAIARRVAPVVIAAMIGAGCGDPGAPDYDAGPIVHDAGIMLSPDAGPAVPDAGIAPAIDAGTSGD